MERENEEERRKTIKIKELPKYEDDDDVSGKGRPQKREEKMIMIAKLINNDYDRQMKVDTMENMAE